MSTPKPAQPSWWLDHNGNTEGPHSQAYVLAMLRGGRLSPSALACPVGSQQWRTLREWPQFVGNGAPVPAAPALPVAAPAPPSPQSPFDFDHSTPTPTRSSFRPRPKNTYTQYAPFGWVSAGVCFFLMLACIGGRVSVEEEAAVVHAELNRMSGFDYQFSAHLEHNARSSMGDFYGKPFEETQKVQALLAHLEELDNEYVGLGILALLFFLGTGAGLAAGAVLQFGKFG